MLKLRKEISLYGEKRENGRLIWSYSYSVEMMKKKLEYALA